LVRVGRSAEDARGRGGGILYETAVHPTIGPPVVEAWSVQRVADCLHVSESTVRRLIQAQAFPGAFRVGGKLVRIPVTDLEAYRQARLLVRRTEGQMTREADVPLPFEGSDARSA
jgi:excisionase family DNA binding protein